MHPQLTPRDIARFWSKVDRSGGPDACWPWLGWRFSKSGYAGFDVGSDSGEKRQRIGAHRIAFFLTHGHWAEPMTLHSCPGGGTPECCNPGHLYEGTWTDNARDMVNAGRHRNCAVTQPERLSRGDDHYARTNPERLARGDKHGSHTHPERLARGEAHGKSKLTNAQVAEIRRRYAAGDVTKTALAHEFGVSRTCVFDLVKGRCRS